VAITNLETAILWVQHAESIDAIANGTEAQLEHPQ
jgi:hypothetical protein